MLRCSGTSQPSEPFPGSGRTLENDPESEPRGEEVQIAMSEAISEISPALVEKDSVLLRGNAPLDTDTPMGARPLITVNVASTSRVDVRRDAMFIDRKPPNQTAAEVVNRGMIIIIRVIESIADSLGD